MKSVLEHRRMCQHDSHSGRFNKTAKAIVKPPALCAPYMTERLWPRLSAAHSCIWITQLYYGLEARERTKFVCIRAITMQASASSRHSGTRPGVALQKVCLKSQ